MRSFFQFFTQKLRLSNPWRYKVPLLIGFCYFLLLAGHVEAYNTYMAFFAAIATTIGFMGFGYLTNDLADRKKDALAGKSNGTSNLSKLSIVLLVVGFITIAILPWFYLPMDVISGILILAELLLFVLYAFPPFRLKERGFLGVITDSLYAHVVPGFLASWTFYLVGDKQYEHFFYFVIALSIWQFLSGIRNIISHHYKDFENDLTSSTKTFAIQIGKTKVYQLMSKVLVPLEVISVLAFLVVVQLQIPFLVAVIALFVLLAWSDYRTGESDTKVKHFTNTFLDHFYIRWFPYIVLFTLTFSNFEFGVMLVFHFLLFHPFMGNVFGRLSSKNRKQSEEKSVRTYAILSTNRDKYSETFIQAHIRHISNAVVYSDGYFPTSVSLDRGKTWDDLSSTDDLESALIQSWKDHNVKSVLAEYGPAGAEVMHACLKAKIPLVVHFHGFDAYRDDVLGHYSTEYKVLFEIASKIVVVSNDMKVQLLHLGCPEGKIEKITYGVDTDLFASPSSPRKREHFIACGRFVPKKSPLSTIRAFAKVVEHNRSAQLTFIGDGELLDSAKRLTEELNLNQHIDFAGVLEPSEVAEQLRKHAIFVQHSVRTDQNDSEGTPLSVLEAASTGLAIVATNHAGISDVIENEVSGFLVEEGDVEAMSERMIQLLEDANLREQFGAKARATILKNHHQTDYLSALEDALETAEIPQRKESRLNIWKKRMLVFLVLFLITEIALRLIGYKPGVIEDYYYHRGAIVYDSVLYADEVGITHAIQGMNLIVDGEINTEGFFSSIEFTEESMSAIRKSGKKIVMLIGDSYTHGCCADSYYASFAHLINQSDDYEVLNFGIPGADPVQYRLIVEKYAARLKPDLILVAVYGGNDIMEYNRTAKPFIPLSYPIKNGPWLNSEGPIYLTKQGTYFKNFDEAKDHYFDYFSLWGDDASSFEKMIRYSVILSRPYMKWKTSRQFEKVKDQMPKSLVRMPYSNENLSSLVSTAKDKDIPVVFSLIPSPSDVQSKIDFHKKYDFVFGEFEYKVPRNIKVEDYDGLTDGNHFNNQGHQKYAKFLTTLIQANLKE